MPLQPRPITPLSQSHFEHYPQGFNQIEDIETRVKKNWLILGLKPILEFLGFTLVTHPIKGVYFWVIQVNNERFKSGTVIVPKALGINDEVR